MVYYTYSISGRRNEQGSMELKEKGYLPEHHFKLQKLIKKQIESRLADDNLVIKNIRTTITMTH